MNLISECQIHCKWKKKGFRGATLRERSKRFATGTFQQINIISKGHMSVSRDSPVKRNLTNLILPISSHPQTFLKLISNLSTDLGGGLFLEKKFKLLFVQNQQIFQSVSIIFELRVTLLRV